MNNTQVSIVIPTFNRAHYLENCINSCLAQTQPCEIIVCDHGSTDNTPDMVKKFEGKIKYVRREIDSGVHFCWLDGVLHAQHDFIHINFDDDWIEPTFIEKTISLMDDTVGCVFSDAMVYFEQTNTYSPIIFNLFKKTGKYDSKILAEYNLKCLTSPAAGIFRKKVLVDNLYVGSVPFSSNEYHGVGPDILFSLMSTTSYPYFGFVAEPLAIFRSHEESISVNASMDKDKERNIYLAYEDARNYYLLNYKFKNMFKSKIFNLFKKYITK